MWNTAGVSGTVGPDFIMLTRYIRYGYSQRVPCAFGAERAPLTLSRYRCRVGMWRGVGRCSLSVAAPFVWRCLSNCPVAPFPHPSHRTGQAELPHPALGLDITPSLDLTRFSGHITVTQRGVQNVEERQ